MSEVSENAQPSADGAWEAPDAENAPAAVDAFYVEIAGFEGPLDLLLAMARTQKVDIGSISVSQLVEQYLAYIGQAQRLKLEIAADYLVMAAWLAFLKSKLLLPKEKEDDDQPSAEEMARHLAFRLQRLEAMRNAASQLLTRKRLHRDIFPRGMPEGVKTVRETEWTAEVYDLLKAYADGRRRNVTVTHVVKARKVWSIKDARTRLEKLLGGSTQGNWEQLDLFIEQYLPRSEEDRTVLASSFGATLEMAREGLVELRQDAPFAPIYMRKLEEGASWELLV